MTVGAVDDLADHFARHAGEVDAGTRPLRDGLRYLAERGLIGHPDPVVQAAVVRRVASGCLASAFVLWAQTMVAGYLDRAATEELAVAAAALRRGTLAGSTAMAGAFQDADGFRPLETTFVRDRDEFVVDGTVRWASNLDPDGFVVVLAAVGSDGERVVVAVPSGTPGLSIRPQPELLALSGTASASVALAGVRVPRTRVVTEDFTAFLDEVRPLFLGLQAAYCIGLGEAALAAAAGPAARGFVGFADDQAVLVSRRDALALDLGRVCTIGADADAAVLVRFRLDAARFAQDAVAHEVRVTGGAGYLAASSTARRVREAAFLPVQSPTEGHLRWKLAQFAS